MVLYYVSAVAGQRRQKCNLLDILTFSEILKSNCHTVLLTDHFVKKIRDLKHKLFLIESVHDEMVILITKSPWQQEASRS